MRLRLFIALADYGGGYDSLRWDTRLMLTYAEIASYIDAGQTDAEVAASLNADLRHLRDTFITGGPSDTASVNVLFLLTSKWGVLRQNTAQQWIGSLVDLSGANEQVRQVLEQLFPYLQVNDAVVYCGVSNSAAMLVEFLIGTVGALVGDIELVRADVAVLTGGRRYGSVTEQQVAAVRVAHELEELKSSLIQAARDTFETYRVTVNEWNGVGNPPQM